MGVIFNYQIKQKKIIKRKKKSKKRGTVQWDRIKNQATYRNNRTVRNLEIEPKSSNRTDILENKNNRWKSSYRKKSKEEVRERKINRGGYKVKLTEPMLYELPD